MPLHTVEAPEKIEVPPGAAEFAVGHGLQADLFLLLDDALDLAVLQGLEIGGRQLAFGPLCARVFQRGGPQQAADMIGPEGRFGALHALPHTSSAMSTIIASFAHCSSSASTLPSSVEAKPHCGESAS